MAPIRGRRLFEGGIYFARRASTAAASCPQRYVNFVLGLMLTPAQMIADLELSSSAGLCECDRYLSHVCNVTGSTLLRMRNATVNMINAAIIQWRPLLHSTRVLCSVHSRAAFIQGAAFI